MTILPILLTLLPYFANAANDWNKPCFQGTCSYDVAPSATSMSGSMTIGGSTKAISDITPAAGWEILGCDPNALSQDIRLVCKSSDAPSVGCDHLYENGAENTIVRLPENCLKVPFARVARAWVPADQSIPTSIAHRIMKRQDGGTPQVQALTLDTNWTAAADNQNGNVTLFVTGSTIPGEQGNATITPPSQRRSRVQRRGLDIKGLVKDIFSNSFDKNIRTTVPPIDINQKFPIFNTSTQCSGTSGASAAASVNINADAKVHAEITLGVVASGTLLPPIVDSFSLVAGLTANLDGTLNIDAALSGTLDSGLIPLFETGIPGLEIPEVFSIGPEFALNARATATLDVNVNMGIDLAYDVQKLQLVFPPTSDQPSSGSPTPRDTPLKLSVSPQVSSKGTIEAHVIPTINFGITALGGKAASATVFLNVDASAALTLTLNAQANATAQTNGTTSTGASVDGCVDVSGGVSANAGARGSFLNFFDDSTSVPIFSKNFDIFKKCFGASTGSSTKRSETAVRALPFEKRASGLSCPSSGIGSELASLAEETVSASAFQSKN
ncbi:hypothetical protein BD410DRAFT_868623 [Rickenella mellea]|uniref:DUF7223 domain-containing protein n=1 Tax=Rickenella mellea TaxID=50990 RepID=A0A4Y7Q0G5_9AGAM|nr:hypothetical protein BD410DRAFT_868623 [Rickenella mellea]